MPISDPQQEAWQQAESQRLVNLAIGLAGSVRLLRVNVQMAIEAQELSNEAQTFLYDELLKTAALLEVKG